MAQASGVVRVLIVPLSSEDPLVDHLFVLPALVNAATNGWFSQMYASAQMYALMIPPGSPAITRGIRVELVTTTAGDANLVATSLPALQSELGLASPIVTWAETLLMGY